MRISNEALYAIVNESRSLGDVYKTVGITGGNSRHLLKKRIETLDIPTEHFDGRPRIKRQELLHRALELRKSGLGYVRIGKLLDVPWNTVRAWVKHIKIPREISMGLAAERIKKTSPKSKDSIRKRLIEHRGYACEGCGLSEWRGERLTLELHRLKQGKYHEVPLQLLCPNCHSITKNWRGKGKIIKLAPVAEQADALASNTSV